MRTMTDREVDERLEAVRKKYIPLDRKAWEKELEQLMKGKWAEVNETENIKVTVPEHLRGEKEFVSDLHDWLFRVAGVESLLGELYWDIDGLDYDITSDFKIDSHPHMAYDGDKVTVGYRLYSNGDNKHMIKRKKETLDRIMGKSPYRLMENTKAEGIRWELYLPFEPGRKCEGLEKERILGMLEKKRLGSREDVAFDITLDIVDNTLAISMDIRSAKEQFYQSKKEWFRKVMARRVHEAEEEKVLSEYELYHSAEDAMDHWRRKRYW